MSEQVRGIVKWFKQNKGFGFIVSEEKEYFVHFSAIKCNGFKTLLPGTKVVFKIQESPKGMKAIDVEEIPSHVENPKNAYRSYKAENSVNRN